jgi:hypothetical protein
MIILGGSNGIFGNTESLEGFYEKRQGICVIWVNYRG